MKTSFKGFIATVVLLLFGANLLLIGQANKQTEQVGQVGQVTQAGQVSQAGPERKVGQVRQAGQTDNTEFKLSKTINLNGESEKVEIIIPVTEKITGLSIKISSITIAGEITIEVYDPAGEKMGNYSVGSQNSIKVVGKTYNPTQNESVAGEITKSVIFPKIGNWTVNVVPKNAKGSISLESIQSSLKR